MSENSKILTVSQLRHTKIRSDQAFRAMSLFLLEYFERGGRQGALSALVGDTELEKNGTSSDPAALSDWVDCVDAILIADGELN